MGVGLQMGFNDGSYEHEQNQKIVDQEKEISRLLKLVAAADALADASSKATCDSHSGEYCDEECANVILPPAVKAYKALRGKDLGKDS